MTVKGEHLKYMFLQRLYEIRSKSEHFKCLQKIFANIVIDF